jgi:MAP3K TRAFs-binding domain
MLDDQAGAAGSRLRCFVVMGFGVKTDYATGRKLDLDKSYRLLIKPVVEEKSLVCVRADEIRHSGSIDVQMYRELLTADVVIADLSTANPNALYELGVRHALRPRTTVVISEKGLPYPFDLNHVVITGYTHLGESIDYDEVLRFRQLLGETIESVLRGQQTDSPVYDHLKHLTPPRLGSEAAQALARAGEAVARAGEAVAEEARRSEPHAAGSSDPTLAAFVEQGEEAIRESQFVVAKSMFAAALRLGKLAALQGGAIGHDPYLIQRLVLATYKAKQPNETAALQEALGLLAKLDLENTNDPETVGLAGAIEKRLFDRTQDAEHLQRAVRYYARGYYLRDDRYNGINLAYLLNLRTDTPFDAADQERIADLVWANRIRRHVLELCARELAGIRDRERRTAATQYAFCRDQRARDQEQEFWALATKAEAHFGLGEHEAYVEARAEAGRVQSADWMLGTLDGQVERLRGLLTKHGHLLEPPWTNSADKWAEEPRRSAPSGGAGGRGRTSDTGGVSAVLYR